MLKTFASTTAIGLALSAIVPAQLYAQDEEEKSGGFAIEDLSIYSNGVSIL